MITIYHIFERINVGNSREKRRWAEALYNDLIGALTGRGYRNLSFEREFDELSPCVSPLIIIAALIALALFFNSGGAAIFGFIGNAGSGLGISGQDIAVIVLILVTVLVIFWLTKGEGKTKTPGQANE